MCLFLVSKQFFGTVEPLVAHIALEGITMDIHHMVLIGIPAQDLMITQFAVVDLMSQSMDPDIVLIFEYFKTKVTLHFTSS